MKPWSYLSGMRNSKKARGQSSPILSFVPWLVLVLGYPVASGVHMLKDQPFHIDWLFGFLVTLGMGPSLYVWLAMKKIKCPQAYCRPFHVGQTGFLDITVENKSRFPLPVATIKQGQHSETFSLGARSSKQVRLPVMAASRGTSLPPELRLESSYPFHIFTTWKTFQPMGNCIIYPAPEMDPPTWPTHVEHGHRKARKGEDVCGFRDYRNDDPLNIVDWKSTAKAGKVIVREYVEQEPVLVFAWEDVEKLEAEAAISRLTAWVLMAHAQGRTWTLDLPGAPVVAHGNTDAHKHACLALLADYRKPAP